MATATLVRNGAGEVSGVKLDLTLQEAQYVRNLTGGAEFGGTDTPDHGIYAALCEVGFGYTGQRCDAIPRTQFVGEVSHVE